MLSKHSSLLESSYNSKVKHQLRVMKIRGEIGLLEAVGHSIEV